MKDKRFELIAKYALVLSVLQILSIAFIRLTIEFEFVKNDNDNALLRQTIPIAFNLFLNLVAAFIVGQDIKKYNVKTKYAVIATIVYRPLGIFAFLLFLFLQDEVEADNQKRLD